MDIQKIKDKLNELFDINRVVFWNDGFLPDDLTLDMLKETHASKPRNPLIADVCFKGGYIDAWGRGIEKIQDACRDAVLPEPIFEEHCGGMRVTLLGKKGAIDRSAPEVTPEVLNMLNVIKGEMYRREIQKALGLNDEKHFREYYQQVAVAMGLIEMTIPDKPRSSKQKYRLTEKGKKYLK